MDTEKVGETLEVWEVQKPVLGEEEWRPIKGYKDRYEVSNYGRVRGPRGFIGWKGKNRYRIASLHGERRDPLKVPVSGRHFKYEVKVYIHQLVMEAFVGPCPEGLEINHIDGSRDNNRLDNLEYITHGANIKHAYTLGKRKPNGDYKHTKEIVETLYQRVQAGEKIIRVARDLGIKERMGYELLYRREHRLNAR